MANEPSVVAWLVAGGGGTVLGSIVMSVIQAFGKHGRDRADAADLATAAAGRVIERLELENVRMREAILTISDVLDSVIDDLDADAKAKAALKQALRAAKLAAV